MSREAPQRMVGRYELIREIGRGGMAVVHLARQPELDRFVAIKELASFYAADAAMADRFLKEARLAGSLSHPNIVTVYDYIAQDGVPYILMEYLPRGSLRPLARRLSLAQAVGALQAVLAGLEAAGAHSIVHRDLKPENLMVGGDSVKIADFGIAKAVSDVTVGDFRTATGTTIGTPTYMAPEQAMAKPVTGATDLYSLGVIAYELLVGRVPFNGDDNPLAVLLRQVNDAPAPPLTIRPDLDPELAEWITWLMAKEPDDRPGSARIAAEALEDVAIRLLGPRWRRSATLPAIASATVSDAAPAPETPAPRPFLSGTYVTVDPLQGDARPAEATTPAPEPTATPTPEPTPSPEPAPPPVPQPTPAPAPQAASDLGPPLAPPLEPAARAPVSEPAPAVTIPPRDQPPAATPPTVAPQPAARPWRRWRWLAVFAASAAVAAAGAAAVRQLTSSGGSNGQPPASTAAGGGQIDLKPFRPGRARAYTIDPPPGWDCRFEPCREKQAPGIKTPAFEVDFVRGSQGVSVLRYPLNAAQRGSAPRALFRGAVGDALHKVGGFPANPPAGDVHSLGGRRTWEYDASGTQTAASGITFVADDNGYWVSGLGTPASSVKAAVHDFASGLTPRSGSRGGHA